MKKWKSWLKGIVDSSKPHPPILVTGSAKIDTYKKVGDSLAGRYFSFRLHPLDIKEIISFSQKKIDPESVLNTLLKVSGFPEPYLNGSESFYRRWQLSHLDVILKQDILETESIRNIKQLETLAILLTENVGSLLSYNSIRENLQTDDKSIKRWIDILENSYVVFRIYPYHTKSMATALKKTPKLYYFDYCRVDDPSKKLENLVAHALLKEVHYRRDIKGEVFDLQYIRNKNGKEIDFLITKNKKPHALIEVKEGDNSPSDNFKVFEKYFSGVRKIQLVKNLKKDFVTNNYIEILNLSNWLAKMDF